MESFMSHTEQIRNLGLKVTGPRLKILKLFESRANEHLSAEDVYRITLDEDMNIIEQHQNNFVSQLNTLMNNLNILEENINKDFDELENFIENDIEKELLSK